MSWIPRSRYALRALQIASYVARGREKLAQGQAGFSEARRAEWFVKLWRQTAQAVGAEFDVLSGSLCQIRLGDRVTRVNRHMVMLDDPVTLALAGNKPLVHRLLLEKGLPVPPYAVFRLDSLDTAWRFIEEQGAPCVVKPSRGTGGGRGITTGVSTSRQLVKAAVYAATHGAELIAERQIQGENLRLLYLDGVLLDAVRRGAPRIVGDGRSTIAALIEAENRTRAGDPDRAALGGITVDPDCRATLRGAGLSLRSVPAAGQTVTVKTATNQGSDQDNDSVAGTLCPELIRDGATAAAALGVRLAGVDMITTDLTEPLEATGGVINEVNTTPGLHFHYFVRNVDAHRPVAATILQSLLGLPEVPAECRGAGSVEAHGVADGTAPQRGE